MLSELHIQIAAKLAGFVLQTRFQTRKTLFERVQSTFQTARQQKNVSFSSTSHFLNQLLPKDNYHVQEKLLKQQAGRLTVSLQVRFFLNDRTKGNQVQAQHWQIMIARRKMHEKEDEFKMVAQFFEEAVIILKKTPLFRVYRNDRNLKMRYFLQNAILVDTAESPCIFDLPGRHYLQRQNESLQLKATVSYLPSLDHLLPKETLNSPSKRKESGVLSECQDDRTVSVYAFYDPDQNFHFLSSDDEDFRTDKDDKLQEIKISKEEELSEEYELLILDDDQNFVDDNKELFDGVDSASGNYLIN